MIIDFLPPWVYFFNGNFNTTVRFSRTNFNERKNTELLYANSEILTSNGSSNRIRNKPKIGENYTFKICTASPDTTTALLVGTSKTFVLK